MTETHRSDKGVDDGDKVDLNSRGHHQYDTRDPALYDEDSDAQTNTH